MKLLCAAFWRFQPGNAVWCATWPSKLRTNPFQSNDHSPNAQDLRLTLGLIYLTVVSLDPGRCYVELAKENTLVSCGAGVAVASRGGPNVTVNQPIGKLEKWISVIEKGLLCSDHKC